MRIRETEGVEAIHCPESDISQVLELTCPLLPDSSLVSMELSFFFPLILPWDQPSVTLWEIKYQDVGNMRFKFGQTVGVFLLLSFSFLMVVVRQIILHTWDQRSALNNVTTLTEQRQSTDDIISLFSISNRNFLRQILANISWKHFGISRNALQWDQQQNSIMVMLTICWSRLHKEFNIFGIGIPMKQDPCGSLLWWCDCCNAQQSGNHFEFFFLPWCEKGTFIYLGPIRMNSRHLQTLDLHALLGNVLTSETHLHTPVAFNMKYLTA